MAQWIFAFKNSKKYPKPKTEIDDLVEIEKECGKVFLPLADRKDAPGRRAEPGDTIFLCIASKEVGVHVAMASALVVENCGELESPPGDLGSLYPDLKTRRTWLQISLEKFAEPKSHEDLGLPAEKLVFKGSLYVRKV